MIKNKIKLKDLKHRNNFLLNEVSYLVKKSILINQSISVKKRFLVQIYVNKKRYYLKMNNYCLLTKSFTVLKNIKFSRHIFKKFIIDSLNGLKKK